MINDASSASIATFLDPLPLPASQSLDRPPRRTVSPPIKPSFSPSPSRSSRRRRRQKSRSPSAQPPSGLKILIAPSGFKEALGPEDVAQAIEDGLRRVLSDEEAVTIAKLPLHDGGEGFCKALVALKDGEIRQKTVIGPVGEPVESHWGIVELTASGDQGEGTPKTRRRAAVLDMAAAAGLRLVPEGQRDPTRTTTFGVGELIKAALDEEGENITDIIIGCGDSGTSDGGAGMLQALGAHLLDSEGNDLPRAAGGATLSELASITLEDVHPRLRATGDDKVVIQAVCNVENVLCGEHGVARVYGPQKGATETQIETLSGGLENLAHSMQPILDRDISTAPGSGASGGLGAGLLLLGAELRPRSEAINDYFHIDEMLDEEWDFVFTAEGSLDSQSAKGKMTVEIARRAAQSCGALVVALAGTIGRGADAVYFEGIEAFTSILREPVSLEDALRDTEKLLRDEAERSMRMILVGMAAMRDSGVDVEEEMLKASPSRPEIVRVFTQ